MPPNQLQNSFLSCFKRLFQVFAHSYDNIVSVSKFTETNSSCYRKEYIVKFLSANYASAIAQNSKSVSFIVARNI